MSYSFYISLPVFFSSFLRNLRDYRFDTALYCCCLPHRLFGEKPTVKPAGLLAHADIHKRAYVRVCDGRQIEHVSQQ